MPVDELQMLLDLDELPQDADDYDTVGGFVPSAIGSYPIRG